MNTQDNESFLSFNEQTKAAEIRFAALMAEKNIPFHSAQDILSFFQEIGQNSNILNNMTTGRTKCSNIISNVLYPVERENVV
ncbi:hypothetical protein X777_12296 [Ooceraea biroi]|uniref:Uncharacterized protein n=1 Tax=Ooceraea biroi TaxID=2015173 RepID=A0A026X1X0_OOCBI|nr:hypothetical protein X777_12296 [Ooceraea biroi]